MRTTISQVNAFSDQPFLGNPAGIVTDATGLSEAVMQRLARQMNLSETAFILPSQQPEAQVRIRWFTPSCEVPLCGHATIASFYALTLEGRYGLGSRGEHALKVECQVGILPIRVVHEAERITVFFGLPLPDFHDINFNVDELAGLLGIAAGDFEYSILPKRHGDYWYIPVKNLEVMRRVRPEFERLRTWMGSPVLALFTMETFESTSDWHMRFFAPRYGINEDPVTGSAQGPMAVYMTFFGPESKRGQRSFVGEQGDILDRAGRVQVNLLDQDGRVAGVEIGGTAVLMQTGEIFW